MSYRNYTLTEIDPLAREISVAWFEGYKPNNSHIPDIGQKVKLASDIMNYADEKIKQLKEWNDKLERINAKLEDEITDLQGQISERQSQLG